MIRIRRASGRRAPRARRCAATLAKGCLLSICLALVAAPASSFDPTGVEDALGAYRNRAEIAAFVRVEPNACFDLGGGETLCEWVLGNRDAAWAPLADAARTKDRINVLCVLPEDGSRREPGSCRAYPRRSNRSEFSAARGYGKMRKESPAQRQRKLAGKRAQAKRDLDAARTLVELSHLVGAAPSSCEEITETRRICRWHTTSHTFGHGTLAAIIEASGSKKVVLQCDLPRDGGARRPDACFAAVGN